METVLSALSLALASLLLVRIFSHKCNEHILINQEYPILFWKFLLAWEFRGYNDSMQTSHDVIKELYSSGKPERIGLRDSPWKDALEKWITQGYPANSDGTPVSPADHFGFDMVGVGGGFQWKAKLEPDVIVEEKNDWKIVRDGNGAYFKWWQHKSGTPEHVDFSMTSRKVWEGCRLSTFASSC